MKAEMWDWIVSRKVALHGMAGGLMLMVVGLLVSCASNTSPIIMSPVPTNTPGITLLPPTPSFTPAPTQPTSTAAPTLVRAGFLPTGGPSPTSPLGATFTPAPPSLTVTVAPTLVGLEIMYFTSTSEVISPGDNVTLFWQVLGADQVIIYRLDAEGETDLERPVEDEGRITMPTNPDVLTEAKFLLVALRGSVSDERELAITVNCDVATWFFAPAPGGCPSGPAATTRQAEQRFEGGLMIWVEALDSIFVLYSDAETPRWIRLDDTFEEGMPASDDTIIAPPDRFQPQRGFGLAWRSSPGVRERLGWAIETEAGYDGAIQTAGPPEAVEAIYLRAIDGSVLFLSPDGTDWQIVPLEPSVTPTPE